VYTEALAGLREMSTIIAAAARRKYLGGRADFIKDRKTSMKRTRCVAAVFLRANLA
jgi:hypothetical protein